MTEQQMIQRHMRSYMKELKEHLELAGNPHPYSKTYRDIERAIIFRCGYMAGIKYPNMTEEERNEPF